MIQGINPGLIGVEAVVFLLGILILVLDLLCEGRREVLLSRVAGFGMILAFGYAVLTGDTGTGWHNMIVVDTVALYFKRLFLLAALLVFFLIGRSTELRARSLAGYYALSCFATVGMLFMASAGNLLTLFMALELLTISFYVLVAYGCDRALGLEAGVKYLIIGTVSAAFILLGIALVYGATGILDYAGLAVALRSASVASGLLPVGMFVLLVSLGFKISAIPFHAWAPDVFQGAPSPVVAYLSVGSKAAGFSALLRLVTVVFPSVKTFYLPVMLLVTLGTLFYGNLGALPQKNLKRLLGYSGIAQAGYLLLAIVAGSPEAIAALLYYLTGYLFANLLIFSVIVLYSTRESSFMIGEYAGLGNRSPLLAAALVIGFLSLAGTPPLAGFFGKFLLIMEVIRAGYAWLAGLVIINVVIAMYYYLMVVRTIYVEKTVDYGNLHIPFGFTILLYVYMLAILLLGIFPAPFYRLALLAAQSFL